MSLAVLYLLVLIFVFTAGWSLMPSIRTTIRRKRLGIGNRRKSITRAHWQPRNATPQWWQFWKPASKGFILMLVSVIGLLFYLLTLYFSF
jgi:hypothetical protein